MSQRSIYLFKLKPGQTIDQSKLLINCHLVNIKVCIPIVYCHCTELLVVLVVVVVVDLIIRKTSSVF